MLNDDTNVHRRSMVAWHWTWVLCWVGLGGFVYYWIMLLRMQLAVLWVFEKYLIWDGKEAALGMGLHGLARHSRTRWYSVLCCIVHCNDVLSMDLSIITSVHFIIP